MINIENISFRYDQTRILENYNYKFETSKIYHLRSENGRGKTTLLRLIAGFLSIDSGAIEISGKAVALLKPLCWVEDYIKVKDAFLIFKELVDLKAITLNKVLSIINEHFAIDPNTLHGDLSEGQKNFFYLIALLYSEARFYLVDEGLSSLDQRRKQFIINKIIALKEQGKCIIITDHQLQSDFIDNEVHL